MLLLFCFAPFCSCSDRANKEASPATLYIFAEGAAISKGRKKPAQNQIAVAAEDGSRYQAKITGSEGERVFCPI